LACGPRAEIAAGGVAGTAWGVGLHGSDWQTVDELLQSLSPSRRGKLRAEALAAASRFVLDWWAVIGGLAGVLYDRVELGGIEAETILRGK
jgi:hypothetical protein